MVRAMRQLLVGIDVDEDNVRTEEFKGYEYEYTHQAGVRNSGTS
jgi:hypothetical protein